MNFKHLAAMALAAAAVFASCEKGPAPKVTLPVNDNEMKAIFTQYAEKTVIPTYNKLADAAIELEKACQNIYTKQQAGTLADTDMKAAADAWKSARKFWERSEAFLLGPAGALGIDPHIDSWPLDKSKLDAMFKDDQIMNNLDADYITKHYGADGLCGFHAIEYVLFSEGKVKPATQIDAKYAKYLYAVSGDLKLHTFALEGAWAGLDKISAEKRAFLDEKNIFNVIYDETILNYKDHFINANEEDPIYQTYMQAMIDAVRGDGGCWGIANEVGTAKIYDPQSSKDVLTVESWYSYNSITDFQDNIRGIRMVIMDGGEHSIYNFIKSTNGTLADELKEAIDFTIGEDGKTGIGAMPAPFRDHLGDPMNDKAMDACSHLAAVLEEVGTYLNETYVE